MEVLGNTCGQADEPEARDVADLQSFPNASYWKARKLQKKLKRRLQKGLSRRELGSNADRYIEPEPELDSDGE